MKSENQLKQHDIFQSRSFQLGRQVVRYLDEYYLDGVIGLIPVVGTLVTHCFNIIYIYLALVKLRSKRLALVMISNGLKDMALGLIPVLGNVLDFFYQSNKQNFELIEQFALGNPETVRKVNQQAVIAGVWIVVLLVLICGLIYLSAWFILRLFNMG